MTTVVRVVVLIVEVAGFLYVRILTYQEKFTLAWRSFAFDTALLIGFVACHLFVEWMFRRSPR